MANINKSFVKSPTGICLIILTILSFIAFMLTQFYCGGTERTVCVFLPGEKTSSRATYGQKMAGLALSFTWIGSLILFFLKLCEVKKADLKCWKLTVIRPCFLSSELPYIKDLIMIGLMLGFCFLGFITLIANMGELTASPTWIAATVFLVADIGILIYLIIVIIKHYKRKEGDTGANQTVPKDGMGQPPPKIKSLKVVKLANELQDPKTEPTAASSKSKLETVPKAAAKSTPESIAPIPKVDQATKQNAASEVKNQSEITETETDKTQATESEKGAKQPKSISDS